MESVSTGAPAGSGAVLHPASAIAAGWRTMARDPLRNTLMLIGAHLIYLVIVIIPFVGVVANFLVNPAYLCGIFAFCLRTLRGQKPPFESFFDGFRRWPSATGAVLLVQLAILAFALPLIVVCVATGVAAGVMSSIQHNDTGNLPTLLTLPILIMAAIVLVAVYWWSMRTYGTYFAVMEQDTPDAIGAIKTSFAITRGSVWRIVGFGLLMVGVLALGALLCGIGLLVAIPVVLYATADVYEQLRARAGLPRGILGKARAS